MIELNGEAVFCVLLHAVNSRVGPLAPRVAGDDQGGGADVGAAVSLAPMRNGKAVQIDVRSSHGVFEKSRAFNGDRRNRFYEPAFSFPCLERIKRAQVSVKAERQ